VKLAPIMIVLGITYASPAAACHRFSVWKYPTPQRCGVGHVAHTVYRQPFRAVFPHPVHASDNVANDGRDSISLPVMNDINWGGAMDTPLELELQHLKGVRLLAE
jgi:hypothetical protein